MDLRLDLVGLVVDDMHASLEFYSRLGLEVAEEAADESHVEAVTPGGLRVAWDTADLIRQIDASWTEPTGGQRVTLAFRCPTPADVDAKYAELSALGHGHKEPWDAFWGQRYATVKDPDGNPVDLFAPL
jgi:catechol 2,3-dioxygenase-like lactoylglutathione lyase family enzyme